ncbi:MAG: hypothetical protein JWP01_2625 [Myxococcales bacterium]|nr:hypothetical protein [Myxococcales bacterium]
MIVGILLADHLREAPVDHDGLAELADEDVRRLEVTMDHAALVRVGDSVDRRQHRGQQRQALAQSARARDQLVERTAADPAHDIERTAVGRRAGVIERDDRRVLEPCGDLDLADEPPRDARSLRQDLLERDRASELGCRTPRRRAPCRRDRARRRGDSAGAGSEGSTRASCASECRRRRAVARWPGRCPRGRRSIAVCPRRNPSTPSPESSRTNPDPSRCR